MSYPPHTPGQRVEEHALRWVAAMMGRTCLPRRLPHSTNLHYADDTWVVTFERRAGSGRLDHAAKIVKSLPPGMDPFPAFKVGTVFKRGFRISKWKPGYTLKSVLQVNPENGESQLTGEEFRSALRKMAQMLATVHQLEVDTDAWPERPPSVPLAWEGDLYQRIDPRRLREKLQRVVAQGYLADGDAAKIADRHASLLERVGISVPQSGIIDFATLPGSVPVHLDPHWANWWCINGQVVGLSDWEMAGRGPACVDTYLVLRRLDEAIDSHMDQRTAKTIVEFVRTSSDLPPDVAFDFCELLDIARLVQNLGSYETPAAIAESDFLDVNERRAGEVKSVARLLNTANGRGVFTQLADECQAWGVMSTPPQTQHLQ